jgi:hypothetical protein
MIMSSCAMSNEHVMREGVRAQGNRRMRILLFGDNGFVRSLVGRMLWKHGREVVRSSDPRLEAAASLRDHKRPRCTKVVLPRCNSHIFAGMISCMR